LGLCAILARIGIRPRHIDRRADLAGLLCLKLVRILDQRARPFAVAPTAQDLGQDAKCRRELRLLLADLEQHPLCSLQVALREESPTELDFLSDIGIRC
jgi:hypothetical protein